MKNFNLCCAAISLVGTQLIAAAQTSPTPANSNFASGARVWVKFYSIKNEATVVESKNGKFRVRYEDVDRPDTWVESADLERYNPGNTASGPPLGKYDCYFPMYEHTYMGSFVLKKGNVYQYLTGKKGTGKYRYNAKTRKITWIGGDLAGKVVSSEYTNIAGQGPIITLIFPKGKRKGDIQNCLWRK